LQVKTDQALDVDFLTNQLRATFDAQAKLDACLIASVVRCIQEPFYEAVQAIWPVEPMMVDAYHPLGIQVAVSKPNAVGIDRLLEASAAFHILESGVVVATCGSAITVDLVTDVGSFRGGTILPGLRTGLRALHNMTSLLPNLEVHAPQGVLGTDTETCMLAGVVYGAAGAVDRIYQELCEWNGAHLPLVMTGGDVSYIAPLLKSSYQVEEDLVLRGLVMLDARR